jgi:cobalt-zinc-cadmium efflux system protein
MQDAPDDVDVARLEQRLHDLPGVSDVHDLHVWTLTSGMPVATAHLAARDGTDRDGIVDFARRMLRDEFAIAHATLQVESGSADCTELTW